MPIARLIAGRAFTPEQTRELIYAYERLLGTLNLTDRADPFCEHVAKTIIECATDDDFDRTKVYDRALLKITMR
jgi:hypothetical protein